jgi:hypothetical protein
VAFSLAPQISASVRRGCGCIHRYAGCLSSPAWSRRRKSEAGGWLSSCCKESARYRRGGCDRSKMAAQSSCPKGRVARPECAEILGRFCRECCGRRCSTGGSARSIKLSPDPQRAKKTFLVTVDLGKSGGAYALVDAHSAEEIKARYPWVEIVDRDPPWFDREKFSARPGCHWDIDNPPEHWRNSLVWP